MADFLVSASSAIGTGDTPDLAVHHATAYSLSASTAFVAGPVASSEVDVPRGVWNLSASTTFGMVTYANIPMTWHLDAETRVFIRGDFTLARSLGRFQLGDVVVLEVLPGFVPDAAPVMTVKDGSDATIVTAKMAMNGGPTAFSLPLFLGSLFAVGTFSVTYSYAVAGVTGSASDSFDVVAGGDPGGRVIAMTAYDRAEAQYVVVQMASGYLMQGRNPRF